jgi:hypothetical protein
VSNTREDEQFGFRLPFRALERKDESQCERPIELELTVVDSGYGTWHADRLVDHSITRGVYAFTSDSVSKLADEKQDPVERKSFRKYQCISSPFGISPALTISKHISTSTHCLEHGKSP